MDGKRSTDWLRDAKWGAFGHYLLEAEALAPEMAFGPEEWNRRVDAVDVERLADQIREAGVGYYVMTVGQNTGYYCAPNPAYDRYVGRSPSRCSRRDLIGELAGALAKRGIPMMAYATSGAPTMDEQAIEGLGWEWGYTGKWGQGSRVRTGKRLAEFQLKWQEVLRSYSLLWGDRIRGWWIDGCYFTGEMYDHPDEPNFKSLCDSMRAGNPDALVALNPGVFAPVKAVTPEEDFTAGEIDRAFPLHRERFLKGEQYHILSYIGKWWGHAEIELSREFVSGYTRQVNRTGGVVTWDVPIRPDGTIPDDYVAFLRDVAGEIAKP
jgi:hypothetical protein